MGTVHKAVVLLLCVAIAELIGARAPTRQLGQIPAEDEPDVYYTVVCQSRSMQINCFDGKVIDIQMANYGRHNTDTCYKAGQVEDTNCRATGSLEIVADRCNGRTACVIPANNGIFGGDPCRGTRKYLEVQYECMEPEISDECLSEPCFNGATCEGTLEGYICLCQFGYTGIHCEIVPPPVTTVTVPVPSNLSTSGAVSLPTTKKGQSSTTSIPVPTTQTRSSTASPTTVIPTTDKSTTAEGLSTLITTPAPTATTGKTTRKPPEPTKHHTQPELKLPTTKAPTKAPVEPTEVATTTEKLRLHCPAIRSRDIDWPETMTGEVVTMPCPPGSQGTASWSCDDVPAEWTPSTGPILSDCKSPWVNYITGRVEEIEDVDDINQITELLVRNTNSTKELYGGDLIGCIDVMNNLPVAMEEQLQGLNKMERRQLVTQTTDRNIVSGSNLLTVEHQSAWLDLGKEQQTQEATKLLTGMETNGFLLARELSEGQVQKQTTENILMEVVVEKAAQIKSDGKTFPDTKDTSNNSNWKTISDSISLSQSTLRSKAINGTTKLVFFIYNNVGKFLDGVDDANNNSTDNATRLVNTRVISASLNSVHSGSSLPEPAIIVLQHKHTDRMNSVCAYWNYTVNGDGAWSDYGCETVESNETHTVCSCSHLTNFAVLMDVHGTELPWSHHFTLSVITYAGFMISIVCLVLCLFTFTCFKNLQSDRNTIHKNLCVCLLIAEVLFMAGITQYEKELACTILAAFLHYFFLAAFAWMSLEGIQLYVMLVEVFEAEHSRRKYYYPYGYGVPAVIVGACVGIDYFFYNFRGYGTDRYCWLNTEWGFIWAFVGPVCFVILINMIFLVMAGVIMCRHTRSPTHKKNDKINKLSLGESQLQEVLAWLKGACVLLCLLGITWVFGIMYINDETLVLAYLFTIFNSLQGFFIFVFHCLMNEKVTKEYKRCVRQSSCCPDCIRDQYVSVSMSNNQGSRSSASSKKLRDMWNVQSVSTASTVTDKRLSVSSTGKNNLDPNMKYIPVQREPDAFDELDEINRTQSAASLEKIRLTSFEDRAEHDSGYETLQNKRNQAKNGGESPDSDSRDKSQSDPQLPFLAETSDDGGQRYRSDSQKGLIRNEEVPEAGGRSSAYFRSMPNLPVYSPSSASREPEEEKEKVQATKPLNKSMPNLLDRSRSFLVVTGLPAGSGDYVISRPLTIQQGRTSSENEVKFANIVRVNSEDHETFV